MAGLRSSPRTWSMVGQSSLARAALAAASPFCLESGRMGDGEIEWGKKKLGGRRGPQKRRREMEKWCRKRARFVGERV